MTVCWKSWPNLVCICLSLCATRVVAEEFILQPLNSTVLQGSDVRYTATVVGTWQSMTWTVGEYLVATVHVPGSGNISVFSDQYAARFCVKDDISCVEFFMYNVTRGQSGKVICFVMGKYGSKTADLYVQASGVVSIPGGNVTANQGDQVEFQCAASLWFPDPTITWTRNGEAVNSSLYNTTSVNDVNYFNSTSVLKFQAERNTRVECLATVPTLTKPQSSSVYLVVVPKPPDWTVLIAVVLSFSCAALLALLIIGIIFCYKRRKEKQHTYQDEMSRRVRTQSQLSGVHAPGQRKTGQMNAAYMPDGQTSVAPSQNTDSGFSQANGSQFYEIHDIVNHAGSACNTVDGVMKHRHVTIV
ncbi:Immunoglobulin superfamily member 5 [Collichthys lucidus]|nr:Immunoglobulin superfamily member 5 [Collichthys lucidus]